jgi:hypothetical protein
VVLDAELKSGGDETGVEKQKLDDGVGRANVMWAGGKGRIQEAAKL